MNIAQHLLEVLSKDSDRLAIVEAGGERISRVELRARILRRATGLIRAGLEPGDRIIVQAPPGIELAISAVAVLHAGGVLVLAEAGMAPEVYANRVATAGVSWFAVDRRLRLVHATPGLEWLLRRRGVPLPPPVDPRQAARLVTPLRGEASMPLAAAAVERTAESDAAIIFTGGTTQAPKGVRLSHQALEAYLSGIGSLTARHAVESFVADTPQQILYGLYLGIGVWVPKGRGDRRARVIAECLSRGEAQMFFGPPSTWTRILNLARHRALKSPTKLQLVMLGGAPVSNPMLEELERWLPERTEIRIIYGLTEVGPACSCTSATRLRWLGQGNLVGTALPGIQMFITNADSDGVGELELGGPSVCSGYVGHDPSGGVVSTGDLARLVDFEGETHLVLMGRKKDMVIRQGVNIYPSAVEPVVLGICDGRGRPLVKDCALVGVWDHSREDEHVVLFYVPSPELAITASQPKDRLLVALSTELAPDTLMQVDAIPSTGRQQKPDKVALRLQAAQALGLSAKDAAVAGTDRRQHEETVA